MIAKPISMEETLEEMAQNSYDLLGDIIAAQCLCACINLEESYPEDVIAFYRYRLADYMKQHCEEIAVLVANATKQLKSVEETFLQ